MKIRRRPPSRFAGSVGRRGLWFSPCRIYRSAGCLIRGFCKFGTKRGHVHAGQEKEKEKESGAAAVLEAEA